MENKKSFGKNKLILIGIAVFLVMIFPVIANFSFFSWDSRYAHGSLDTWISSLATYFGAIIGGIISGTLTLIGVRKTIKSTVESMNKNIKEQKIIREEELRIQSNKDRLKNFYIPLNLHLSMLEHKQGAHNFTDLSFKEQAEFIKIINENLFYADSEMNIRVLEMNWVLKENCSKDFKILDGNYQKISDLCREEVNKLRKQLKLPPIEYEADMWNV